MFGFPYFNIKVYMPIFLYKDAIKDIIFDLGLSIMFLKIYLLTKRNDFVSFRLSQCHHLIPGMYENNLRITCNVFYMDTKFS